jgi:cyclopropane fatty-acyl-phospholipid synthase-like methyltransferase
MTPRALLSIIALLVCTTACKHSESHGAAQSGHHGGGMPHRFENAEEWAKRFEEPERDAWQKPDEVVAALALAPEAKVADIGSATGYFAVRLARAVPAGRVYGVDVEPDMARYLGERAKREGLTNLEAVLGEPGDAKLPEAVDVALIVDTYHHIGEREAWLRRLGEKLRPEGRVVIIDFRLESPKGPPTRHKLSAEQVRGELEAAGYRLTRTHDFLPDQYFLEFQRG